MNTSSEFSTRPDDYLIVSIKNGEVTIQLGTYYRNFDGNWCATGGDYMDTKPLPKSRKASQFVTFELPVSEGARHRRED